MKIINYNRGLVAKNIENLRAQTTAQNKKKIAISTTIKGIICGIIVLISSIGFLHVQAYETTNIFPVIGSLISLTAALATILFSIAITEVSDYGWLKQRTFEMLYYDTDNKGKITSIKKHPERNTILVSWLDENKYVSTTELALNNVVSTTSVDEDTLDVSHGTLLCNYNEEPNVVYAN